MTGEEMNWRIFYSNIEASSKDRAARIAIEQFYRSEHRDIGHLGGARVESVDNPHDFAMVHGFPSVCLSRSIQKA
jgi:hypothetical protein